VPALTVRTPLGALGIGNAARGLCGGMVFAALDYWQAGQVPPPDRPEPGSALFRFIVRRLVDSWRLPAGVARYYGWMNLPAADARLRGGMRIRGLAHRSVSRHWPAVRASLDRGQPVPLGLVTVASANPLLLGRNHQVLAYGYQAEGGRVKIAVYDPNSGQDDGVHIQFDTSDRTAATLFQHNISIGRPLRGFFLTVYSPVMPPGTVRPAR
jgi:hypothetical protein